MFRANLLVAFRSLIKYSVSSTINLIGLSIAMAITILTSLWILDELSYNKYHEKHDRIAAVLQTQTFGDDVQTWWGQVLHFADYLREHYGSNFEQVVLSDWEAGRLFTHEDESTEQTGLFMEPYGPKCLLYKCFMGR